MLVKLLQSVSPCDWIQSIDRKARDWIPDLPPDWLWTQQQFDALQPILKKGGVRISMNVLKSIANTWTTSTRMHADITLPCIFGCDDSDALSH